MEKCVILVIMKGWISISEVYIVSVMVESIFGFFKSQPGNLNTTILQFQSESLS
jgi:hypothetical protein